MYRAIIVMNFGFIKGLFILSLSGILIAVQVFLAVNTYAQLPAKEIKKQEWADKNKELKEMYGANKQLDPYFELASLIALSQFPELIPLNIDIVYSKIKTTMQARPTLGFLLKKKESRRYKVFINSNEKKLKGCALKNVPFDAQVGILAHEFAHVLHYNSMSTIE